MKLMTHLIAGYPTLKKSQALALALANAGADILEIQLPFSDPIADGPLIAGANHDALRKGFTILQGLMMIQDMKKEISAPVFVMTYFNIVYRFGIQEFCKKVSATGVTGLIIPDYPYDEEKDNGLIAACRENHLDFIPVIAPHFKSERLKEVLKNGSGFVYCVARSGVTGSNTKVTRQVIHYLKSVRKMTALPLAVGFGLSQKEQIQALDPYADIAVVGSAIVKKFQNQPFNEAIKASEKLIYELKH